MQINNNFNRTSTPQFGMALKISKGGEKYLKSQSMDFLRRLAKAGEDMVDFKHYDLEVGEKGLRVKSKNYANAYIEPQLDLNYNPSRFFNSRDVVVNTIYDGIAETGPKGQSYPLLLKTSGDMEAKRLYDEFEIADNLDRHILLTQKLEEQEAKKAGKNAEKFSLETKVQNAISNLMEKFGV